MNFKLNYFSTIFILSSYLCVCILCSCSPSQEGENEKNNLKIGKASDEDKSFDLTKESILHFDKRISITKGFKWSPESESSHHRVGVLKVSVKGENGSGYQLEIKNLGVPSRKFAWNGA